MHICKRFCSFTNILVVILLSFFFSTYLTSTTHAATMTKDKTFNISGYSNPVVQGATLTKQYYVYTNWDRGSSFTVTRCNRPNGDNCKTSPSFNSGKPSSMYHVWGSNYVQATLKQAKGMVCIDLSTMNKTSDSNCGSILSSSGLSKPGDDDTQRQGWTQYGKIFLRGYGIYSGSCYIWLFTSRNGNPAKSWNIPVGGEVEDVMVDSDTGIVWVAMYQSARTVTYYKVDQSVFSQWIQPGAGGGGGGNYTDPTSDPNKFYDDSNIEVRDETLTTEIPTSSYDGSVDTNFFGPIQDDEQGCGVYMVLNTIIEFLTYGVVIAATIGIAISGLVYLNAKGDLQKTTKAKRRIYEIVIGLAAYAVLYSALEFLLPGGNFNPSNACAEASESSNAVSGWQSNSDTIPVDKPPAQSNLPSDDGATSDNSTGNAAQKLLSAAEKYSGLIIQNKLKYCNKRPYYTWKNVLDKECLNCTDYVTIAAREAGLIKSKSGGIWAGSGKLHGESNLDKSKVKVQQNINKTIASLYKSKKLVPGDIVGAGTGEVDHMMIFKEYKDGKYYFYSVNSKCNGTSTKNTVFKKSCISQKTYSGTWKVGVIIHPL